MMKAEESAMECANPGGINGRFQQNLREPEPVFPGVNINTLLRR